ncbi:MAG: hypothetical protein HYT65_00815 [Candidatus Yanofskybacteria bacterium]|nr:hypothetical protein [Candidatus Yanofskybacteria bacterium]
MNPQKGAKIGLISRIDYGSKGFRQSLLDMAFNVFRKEGTHFNILGAGLISQKDITQEMKAYVKRELNGHKRNSAERFAAKQDLEDKFLIKIAQQLAKIIPITTVPDPENINKEKKIDLFVITSPAFDGVVGERVAQFLSEIRDDIRVWNAGGDRFPVKFVNKLVWALTPQKAVWMRGDYYSTAVERVIKDKRKQTSQSSPDLFIVFGFGSSIHKPKGELEYQYLSVPVCHRLEETRVSENQIGVGVLEFPPDASEHLYRVYNFKDLVSKELSFVVAPERATAIEKKIIDVIKSRGWATPGILQSDLKLPPEDITKALKSLTKKKTFRRKGENWPGIYYQEAAKKHYFDLKYIQEKLKYAVPSGPWQEDRIVNFACIHAGSVETDYHFFVNRVPEIILSSGATTLIDAGDTKEGTRHNLMSKGEIIAGMNNTQQEKFAAHMIGMVMARVFKERFTLAVKDQEKISDALIADLVNRCLLRFVYILGNHDTWEAEDGHDPLELFHITLAKFLTEEIHSYFLSQKLPLCTGLNILIENKIERKEYFNLPSGLKVSIQHPYMARAKTTSLRPQEMLVFAKSSGCQVVIGANFHVSEMVCEWDMDLGQRVCQQIGTIKHGSHFERHKMKQVDQGVGFLRIISKDGKVFMTESAFYGGAKSQPVDNLDLVNSFIESLGIAPITNLKK